MTSSAQKNKTSYISNQLPWQTVHKAFTQKTNNKPYLISIYKKGDYKSNLIDKETYADKSIQKQLKNFNLIKFSKTEKAIVFKGKKFDSFSTCGIKGYGGCGRMNEFLVYLTGSNYNLIGTAFMDENQKLIGYVSGYISKERLHKYMDYILSGNYKKNPENFSSAFVEEGEYY